MITDFRGELARYRQVAERAMAQVSDAALNRVIAPDGNSIAMLVRHMSGNLRSRFTDFLTSDGEKPGRHRDGEFEERPYTRAEVDEMWVVGWKVLDDQLAALGEADLSRPVQLRGLTITVHEALCRALAHMSYHIGQIVLLARASAEQEWKWISIPKGKSEEYNANPTMEKRPH